MITISELECMGSACRDRAHRLFVHVVHIMDIALVIAYFFVITGDEVVPSKLNPTNRIRTIV